MKKYLGNFRRVNQNVIASDPEIVIPAKAGIQNLGLMTGSPIKSFGDDTWCQIASSPTAPRNDNKGKFSLGVFILGLQILLFSRPLFACPMCSDLMQRGKDAFAGMRFGQGIAWSMIFMFAVPALLISSLAFLIWRAERVEHGKKPSKELVHGSKN